MPVVPSSHLPALDGLRGLAALVVVAGHATNAGILHGPLGGQFGQFGVALFFILSAFLMSRLYGHAPFGRAAAETFLWRRLGRVVPLLSVATILGAGLWTLGWQNPYAFERPADPVLALLALYGTGVLWSVPVEIQFYALFVGFWWLRGYLRALPCLLLGLGLQVASVALFVLLGADDETLPFWLHFFLIGLWTEMAWKGLGARWAGPLRAAGPGLVALSVPALVLTPHRVREAIGLPTLPAQVDPWLIATATLVFWLALRGTGPYRHLAAAPLRWLGRISFSVYLLHMPVIMALRPMASDGHRLEAAVLTFGLTLLLAHMSHVLVERPGQWLFPGHRGRRHVAA